MSGAALTASRLPRVGQAQSLTGWWAFLQLWPVTGGMSQVGSAYAGSDGLTSGKKEGVEGGRQMSHFNPRAQPSGAWGATEWPGLKFIKLMI